MLSTNYHETTEYPGLLCSCKQLARAIQRYGFARQFACGKRVLEVACGTGLGLGYLAEVAAFVVGGDIDEVNLTVARASYSAAERVALLGMDAQCLPFPDGSFDLILLSEALYYLSDPFRFVKEASRVLTANGTLLIGVVNGEWKGLHLLSSPHVEQYYSAADLSALVGPQFGEVVSYAGFPVRSDPRSRLLTTVRRAVCALHLMPNTLAGRRWLKWIAYGKLVRMPAVISDSMAPYVAPVRISSAGPVREFEILFLMASRPKTLLTSTG